MKFIVKQIQYNSDNYHETVSLRDKILRKPLGLSFTQDYLEKEVNDIHLAVFLDGKIVGCLILTPLVNEQIQMRQVAVDSSLQKSGVGRLLVEASERLAKDLGFKELILHARETAIPFYLKLNYEIYGEPYTEVSIPHRNMKKAL